MLQLPLVLIVGVAVQAAAPQQPFLHLDGEDLHLSGDPSQLQLLNRHKRYLMNPVGSLVQVISITFLTWQNDLFFCVALFTLNQGSIKKRL